MTMNEDPTAIGSVIDPWHESFYDAIRESDVSTIESVLMGDVVFMPSNDATCRGSVQAREWFDDYFKRFKVDELKETHRSVIVQDKWAFEWGAHSIKISSLNSSQTITDDVRFLHVWQLQPNRRWRLA